MTTKADIDPRAAFPRADRRPGEAALKRALGASFGPLARVFAWVANEYPEATVAWQFSKKPGWYRIAELRKRRLFYLVPRRNDFQLSLILGGKAIAALRAGPNTAEIERLLLTAERYPEGTAFRFDAPHCDPDLIAAMLAAKLAH